MLEKVLDSCDGYTKEHSKRVSLLCEIIANQLDLEKQQVEDARLAGLMHDIGKQKIPEYLLTQTGLSREDKEVFRFHPSDGYEMIKGYGELSNSALEAILYHHERIDGSGYPYGLSNIPILGLVLAVAEVIDSMSCYRPYARQKGIDFAMKEILKNRGRLYDERVVDACFEVFYTPKCPMTQQ